MNDIEAKLKALILSKYKSVLDFAKSIDMPYSTIDNIFKRGVANANITNIIKICTALNISADELAKGQITTKDVYNSRQNNQVIAIARGGEKVQYDLTEAEMQAILTLLDSMKKDK